MGVRQKRGETSDEDENSRLLAVLYYGRCEGSEEFRTSDGTDTAGSPAAAN